MTGTLPSPFAIALEPRRDTVRIVVSGELDLDTVAQLRQRLDEALDVGFGRIEIDLGAVEFLDSSAIHALLDGQDRARAEGWQLSLVAAPPAVHRIFEVTNTVDLLPFSRDGRSGST